VTSPARLSVRDAIGALLVVCAALGLYLATVQPDFGGPEDTPKFQFLGYVLGTAHPPGYPLYVLLSHLFVKLPIGTIAYRANLFSAVMAALACGLSYLIARQIGSTRWPAVGAALGLATGVSFWRNAVFAEVYSLAAVMAALTIVLLLEWAARGGTAWLLAAVAAIGLGFGNHLTILGLVPACVTYAVLRDRRVLTPRVVGAAAVVLLLCVSQYAFIIVRSLQGAPYLESRAGSFSALLRVMTAEDFADKRFAYSVATLVTQQVPATTSVIGREFGIVGAVLLAAGLIAGARTRSAGAALLVGAALGIFAMVVNLSGDLQGFITSLVVFLWPISALGVDALRGWVRVPGGARLAGGVAVVAAAAMPAANVTANYANSDHSQEADAGRYFRSLHAQLPDHAVVVAEDYFYDMALRYLMFTGEGGPDRGIGSIGFGTALVRDVRQAGRRVFAFGRASAFFGADGLLFERAPIAGPPIEQWMKELPRGTLIAGAAAYAAVPFEVSNRRGPSASPHAHPFTAFAYVTGRSGLAWLEGDTTTSLPVNAGTLSSRVPPVTGSIVASADAQGARIEFAGRMIAAADMGLALGVFKADGTLWRVLEFRSDEALRVPPEGVLYELTGEMPCATASTDAWTDVEHVLSTGSWLATFPPLGSVQIETEISGDACDGGVRAREVLGAGSARSVSTTRSGQGEHIVTEFTRAPIGRPLFRSALDCVPMRARARIRAGGVVSSVKVCGHKPASLFPDGATHALVRPDFDSEAYFGAGWGDPERTPTGRVRRGERRATLLLPLAPSHTYQMTLDVVSSGMHLEVALNGVEAGRCDLRNGAPCTFALPPTGIRDGVNALTLSIVGAARADSATPVLVFQGARIVRRPV